MPQIIGVVLIIFGIAGLIGTILFYWWLTRPQGPITRLRQRLLSLSVQLHEAGASAQQVLQLAQNVRTLLGSVDLKIQDVTAQLRLLEEYVRNIVADFEQIRQVFESVRIPTVGSIASTTIPQVGFSVPVVTGVSLSQRTIPGNITVSTPPLKVDIGTVGFSLGPINVISGINFAEGYPLQPLVQYCDSVRWTIEYSAERVKELAVDFVQLGGLPADTRATLDQLINNVLTPLPATLEQASMEARQAANSNLLDLGPLLGLGYLGLMHVAFALIGLALLFV